MTSEEKSRLSAMRKAGRSYTEIAAELGISKNTIKTFCRRNGLTSEVESAPVEVIPAPTTERLCPHCGKPVGDPAPGAEREKVLLGHLPEPLVEQPYGPCQPESYLCLHLPDLWHYLYRLRQQSPEILLSRMLYRGSLRRKDMTGDALKRECLYETVMYQVKRMLGAGLITEKEFQEIEARFRAKYKPISGGYIVQTDLLCARRRVMNGCGKEAGGHEENQCT